MAKKVDMGGAVLAVGDRVILWSSTTRPARVVTVAWEDDPTRVQIRMEDGAQLLRVVHRASLQRVGR